MADKGVICLGQIRGYLPGADKVSSAWGRYGVILLGQIRDYMPETDKQLSAWGI